MSATERIAEESKSATAMILGITGGILGILAGVVAVFVGGAGMLIVGEPTGVAWLGAVAMALGAMGAIAGGMVRSRPVPAGVFMAIAGAGGFLVVSLFWVIPGALLLIGSYSSWSVKQSREELR